MESNLVHSNPVLSSHKKALLKTGLHSQIQKGLNVFLLSIVKDESMIQM